MNKTQVFKMNLIKKYRLTDKKNCQNPKALYNTAHFVFMVSSSLFLVRLIHFLGNFIGKFANFGRFWLKLARNL